MNDYEDAFDLEIKNKVMNKLIFIKSDLPFRHILQPRIPSYTIQNCITY